MMFIQPGPDALRHWTLDPAVTFLNHGSYGACPSVVLEAQAELRARLEREPVHFFTRLLEPLMDEALEALARFLGASPEDLAFVSNASSGVSTVLRSLNLEAGDELLTTTHVYNSCRNALDFVAGRAGAKVVEAAVPFPLASEEEVVEAILRGVTERTRLLLVDHVTSATGVIFPLEEIVPRLREKGIETLVDGAHAPGMLPLQLDALGAAYYTGNCHKWLCAPKGAAFLHVRRDVQQGLHPLTFSHGLNSPRRDRSRFRLEFDFTGTDDPTAFLAVPTALDFFATRFESGWAGVRAHNHALAREARSLLCEALETTPPCPEEMLGSLATVALPEGPPVTVTPGAPDPLHTLLFQRFAIEVPVWPLLGSRWLRISAQVYNQRSQYVQLGAALRELLSP